MPMTVPDFIAKKAVTIAIVRTPFPAAGIIASPYLLRRPHPLSRWLFCDGAAAIAPNSNDQT
jgi:hypothetical protein